MLVAVDAGQALDEAGALSLLAPRPAGPPPPQAE